MFKQIRLRPSTTDEETEIHRLAASRNEPLQLVQRARIVATMDKGPKLTATEAGFKNNAMGAMQVKRFNEEDLAGLEDHPRPGRNSIHSQQVRCGNPL